MSSASLTSEASTIDVRTTLINHPDTHTYAPSDEKGFSEKARRPFRKDGTIWRSLLDFLVLLGLLSVLGLGYVTVEHRRLAENQRHELAVLRAAVAKLLKHQSEYFENAAVEFSTPPEVISGEEEFNTDLIVGGKPVESEEARLHKAFGVVHDDINSDGAGRLKRAPQSKSGGNVKNKKNNVVDCKGLCKIPSNPVSVNGLYGTVFNLVRSAPELIYTRSDTIDGRLKEFQQDDQFGPTTSSLAKLDGFGGSNDHIEILEAGYYMVVAQVTFFHTLGTNGYEIAVEKSTNATSVKTPPEIVVVGMCATSGSTSSVNRKKVHTGSDTTKCATHKFFVPQDSCHTTAIVRLGVGDKISIRIMEADKCVSGKPGATHMSLIRLAS